MARAGLMTRRTMRRAEVMAREASAEREAARLLASGMALIGKGRGFGGAGGGESTKGMKSSMKKPMKATKPTKSQPRAKAMKAMKAAVKKPAAAIKAQPSHRDVQTLLNSAATMAPIRRWKKLPLSPVPPTPAVDGASPVPPPPAVDGAHQEILATSPVPFAADGRKMIEYWRHFDARNISDAWIRAALENDEKGLRIGVKVYPVEDRLTTTRGPPDDEGGARQKV